MSTDFNRNLYFKLAGVSASDSSTRLIIPSKIKDLFSLGFMASLPLLAENVNKRLLKDVLERVLTSGFLNVSVTKIKIKGEHVMPKSKGIGSIGEIIHLMGTKNELLTLDFATDDFPGAFSGILKKIIQSIVQTAGVVYVLDDLIITNACLIKTYEMEKVGSLRGVIVGQLVMEVLPTDEFTLDNSLGTFIKVTKAVVALRVLNNAIIELPVGLKWLLNYAKR